MTNFMKDYNWSRELLYRSAQQIARVTGGKYKVYRRGTWFSVVITIDSGLTEVPVVLRARGNGYYNTANDLEKIYAGWREMPIAKKILELKEAEEQ